MAQAEAFETDPFRQTGAGNPFLNLHIHWVKSVLLLHEGRLEEAKSCFLPVLHLAYQTESHPYVTHGMLVLALFRVAEGEDFEAVQLIALAAAQSRGTVGWIDRWQWLNEVRQAAQSRMGPVRFNAAWKQGASQALMMVARDLVQEFDDDGASRRTGNGTS